MIPEHSIVAWGKIVPWNDNQQIEQDLIISRALVDIFSNDLLRRKLRIRGGTALNKLHFPKPVRYSEDIDLVRTTSGPIRSILGQLRDTLEPWLGRARFDQSVLGPKLKFRIDATNSDGAKIKLKIEINTRETIAFDPPEIRSFKVENPWYSGAVDIPTFSCEEMLATKLRALLRRNKGRDLYDLSHALQVFPDLNLDRTVDFFARYLALSDQSISKAQGQERMFDKLVKQSFLTDMQDLLPFQQARLLSETVERDAFRRVFVTLIDRLPGGDWAKLPEEKDRFGFQW